MTINRNRIIFDSVDWPTLKAKISILSKKEKGDVFELFIKYFLKSHPTYTSIFSHVWLFNELTAAKKKDLNIPSNDQGIDIVAQTKSGEYWAVQCKYLDDEDQRLSHTDISTYGSLAFAISRKFSNGLVCTTAERFSEAYSGQENISFCRSDTWNTLTDEQFNNIRNLAEQKPICLVPYKPFPHQERAITNATIHFVDNLESRGKLIFPCGSGKSLTGFWVAQKVKAKSIIVSVPSLALVRQTLNVWLREAVANKIDVDWICVCSDEAIGKEDDVAVLVQDLGIPSTTNKENIIEWLNRQSNKTKIMFTTYQSGHVVIDAARTANFSFDFGIFDEAHKTVGQKGNLFSLLLYNENILIKKRMFMTATERRFKGQSDNIASMDNVELYGATFELLTFKKALEANPPILSDCKIILVTVGQTEVKSLIERNAFVRPTKGSWNDKVETQTLVSIIALRKSMQRFPIYHAVSFHSSIARAKAFEESQHKVTEVITEFESIESFHVTGATPTSQRTKTIEAFAKSPKALITNARCLTEGVDIPNIDCVLFADPRRSKVDIVQAVGRALRVSKGKTYGYVIIPVLSQMKDGVEVIEDDAYRDLISTVQSLASSDERIVDYFKLKSESDLSNSNRLVDNQLFEISGEQIDLDRLVKEVELRVWGRLAKLKWRPFIQARAFAQSLGLSSAIEWNQYCKSSKKPEDIPSSPSTVYENEGWDGFGDWLGTGNVAISNIEYRPFAEAREFVRSLGLRGYSDWNKYCKSGAKPNDIPNNPHLTYKDTGWKGGGDWFGNGKAAVKYSRPYLQALEFVHSLGLKSRNEWKTYCKSGLKPADIPSSPEISYFGKGWNGMADWLGPSYIEPKINPRPFLDARAFVRTLGLKSSAAWENYCISGNKPKDIPNNPQAIYKNAGWVGYPDWLGYDRIKKYRPFIEARAFVHSLGFTKFKQWKLYCRSGEKPDDIPLNPSTTYKNLGWQGTGDWLGIGKTSFRTSEFLSFEEARAYVRSLNLKNLAEWGEFRKSENRPLNIPSSPDKYYKHHGWINFEDWLGSDYKSARVNFKPFLEAREYVHQLRLESGKEWKQYCQSGSKPADIPATPSQVYAREWKGLMDWLGSGIKSARMNFKPFLEARAYVHQLGLKSGEDWNQYCKSGRKPTDIPANPRQAYAREWKGLRDWLGI